MKGISKEEGITFGDLVDFINDNIGQIPDNTIIRIEPNYDNKNNKLRDILISGDFESIRLFNYI